MAAVNIDEMFEEFLSDDEEVVQIIETPRRPRIFRRRPNHFAIWNEREFLNRFRLSKQCTLTLLEKIEPMLKRATNRNHPVQPLQQLLFALRFLASGGMIISAADFGGIHDSTGSRVILDVATAIASLASEYIKLPQTEEELLRSKRKFHDMAKFPRVIGAIDCTHIRIQSPGGDDAEIYRNRKGYFSLNIQAVSDAELNIVNIVARWPGSAHDSTIFNNSRLRAQFESGVYGDSFLLGDAGYALHKYLMEPLTEPQSRQEKLYNEAQIRTRNSVERLFGVWKRRFPILSMGIRTKLSTTQIIIVATAVLHNICREMRVPEPDVEDQEVQGQDTEENNRRDQIDVDGDNVRRKLIEEYFAGL